MSTVFSSHPKTDPSTARPRRDWIYDVLILVVLLAGLYLRTVGLNWDEIEHLHPDERYMTWVVSDLQPVNSISAYFDTANSTMNPYNRGFTAYVYGTLPLFITRMVGGWFNMTGYDQVQIVGRMLSGFADLITVFFVYLAGSRLYNKKVGLLAGAFSAFAVLQIQLSHYFTVDNFANCFTFIAIYCAILIMKKRVDVSRVVRLPRMLWQSAQYEDEPDGMALPRQEEVETEDDDSWEERPPRKAIDLLKEMAPYIFFGLAIGLAAASKINAVVAAVLLPVAAAIYWYKLPRVERKRQLGLILASLVVAGAVCIVTFRIFQPYAFMGPGFFGIKINQTWLDLMRSLGGQPDYPPQLQWIRRSDLFSLKNIVLWGLGIPLGVLAVSGAIWMLWRIIKGEWSDHLLIWAWTVFYCAWQSLLPAKTMRYQILIYPTLAIIAGWAVWSLWEKGSRARQTASPRKILRWRMTPVQQGKWLKTAAGIIAAVVVVSTFLWAFAFTRIYTRTMTRIAASDWIYDNVPGALNLKVDTTSGEQTQPLAYNFGTYLEVGKPFTMTFQPDADGYLLDLTFDYIAYQGYQDPSNYTNENLQVAISSVSDPNTPLGTMVLSDPFAIQSEPLGQSYTVSFTNPIQVQANQQYYLTLVQLDGAAGLRLSGAVSIGLEDQATATIHQQYLPYMVSTISSDTPYSDTFTAWYTGTVGEITTPHVADLLAGTGNKTLSIEIVGVDATGTVESVTGTLSGVFPTGSDGRGGEGTFQLDTPLYVVEGNSYSFIIQLQDGDGVIGFYASAPAVESSWDDTIPRNLGHAITALGDYNSVYRNRLNFEMYWDDNADKLARFESTLDQSDYIFITSNRQWATTVRVPERYPLTTEYYRDLIGCPDDQDIIYCYSVAQPGTYVGSLGFELVYVAQSEPTLGPLTINTQFSEEAFTVYDHPKVLIFKKTDAYDPATVREILGAVNLNEVVHVAPGDKVGNSASMELPVDRLAAQQAGGTWSQLFDWDALQNKYPVLTVVVWYLAIALLGLIAYPIIRLALPGLKDRGYPLARISGMLLLSFFVWLPGSLGVSVTRMMITYAVLVLALISSILAYFQREELALEWKTKKGYFLTVELVFLAFFALDLAVRIGNPDLWHPDKGGERPMDFSYFNAVIKSTTFPPYDPWFADGYINYYYYGYVIVGMITKWLGIVPSVAYTLILPTLYSTLAVGAFSVAWNLTERTSKLDEPEDQGRFSILRSRSFLVGIAAALGAVFLGNLGTVRMIWYGFQTLGGATSTTASFFTKMIWTFQGIISYVQGANLPYGLGNWYWDPSRAITTTNGWEITEFPAFSFLYGDLHPHVMALPLTVLALGWILSYVLSHGKWGQKNGKNVGLSAVVGFAFGALVIGSLRPTNTWDFYTYILLSSLVILYVSLRYSDDAWTWLGRLDLPYRRMLTAIFRVGLLVGLSLLLFKPFSDWYVQAYSQVTLWEGDKTPFWSYITHWGLFLFVIVSWMFVETRDWMATTPLSALSRFKPYKNLILVCLLLLVGSIAVLTLYGVQITWLVAILGVWVVILMFRPNLPDSKRLVLFIVGTGLALTLFVELVVMKGDIGRMNTIFKFYLQTWTFFVIAAAASLGWLVESFRGWQPRWAPLWQVALTVLVAGAALYPITADLAKIRDRMAQGVPLTLDSMAYMEYATYLENWGVMDLSQDYNAIRWLQENVVGSPVIVEANNRNLYRWGSRMSIYTGLPGVVGWEWHEQQQRPSIADWVSNRISDIDTFYTTTNIGVAQAFLERYNVQYIILGQQERGMYAGDGIAKFDQYNGVYWREVYRQGDTVIYQVDCGCTIPSSTTEK